MKTSKEAVEKLEEIEEFLEFHAEIVRGFINVATDKKLNSLDKVKLKIHKADPKLKPETYIKFYRKIIAVFKEDIDIAMGTLVGGKEIK